MDGESHPLRTVFILNNKYFLFVDHTRISTDRMLGRIGSVRSAHHFSTLLRMRSAFSPKLTSRCYSGIGSFDLMIIVYTYGKGTIGALGHNDYEDKDYPTVCTSFFSLL